MTWTPEIVRQRFIEAADTERYLPSIRMGGGSGYWPMFPHDSEDREGWDDTARLENAEKAKGRAPVGAVSRWEECYFDWTPNHIRQDRRMLVWSFARCRANKWDFGKLCERKGWYKSTAYDRLNRIWQRLSDVLCNTNALLREPANEWSGHDDGVSALYSCRLNSHAQFPAVPKAIIYERSRDLIRTAEDAETFAKFLARHNSAARRERVRRDRREARLLEQIEAA